VAFSIVDASPKEGGNPRKRTNKKMSQTQVQEISQVKLCAPRPERCEKLVQAVIPGVHQFRWYSNGLWTDVIRPIKDVRLYQEGEGSFAYAVEKGTLAVEDGDGISVHEYNHGSFNVSYFLGHNLQSQLTYVEERGGLTALVEFIKSDAMFPDSIREVGDELLINAIAKYNPQSKEPMSFKGLKFQDSFERWVVQWQRAPYNSAKKHWRVFTSRDFVRQNNKILCAGGAASLSRYWVQDILARAEEKRQEGEVEAATAMEMMAKNIFVCPNPRYSNALGMLEIDPVPGRVFSIDFGYSAVKRAEKDAGVSLQESAIAVPMSRINMRDIREGSAFIQLTGGPLFDYLRKKGQPTEYIFGSAADSTLGAEKVINNAKELYIPHAVLASLGPDVDEVAPTKKAKGTTVTL
jgi:hypothetical protein